MTSIKICRKRRLPVVATAMICAKVISSGAASAEQVRLSTSNVGPDYLHFLTERMNDAEDVDLSLAWTPISEADYLTVYVKDRTERLWLPGVVVELLNRAKPEHLSAGTVISANLGDGRRITIQIMFIDDYLGEGKSITQVDCLAAGLTFSEFARVDFDYFLNMREECEVHLE